MPLLGVVAGACRWLRARLGGPSAVLCQEPFRDLEAQTGAEAPSDWTMVSQGGRRGARRSGRLEVFCSQAQR